MGVVQIGALAAGTYRVEFFPSTTAPAGQPAYHSVIRTGVVVTNSQVTPVSTVILN